MAATVQAFEPQIRAILLDPTTDLTSISAKRVRKQLVELDPSVSEFIRANKEALDALIANIFEAVSGPLTNGAEANGDDHDHDHAEQNGHGLSMAPNSQTTAGAATPHHKRKREEDFAEGSGGETPSTTPPPKKLKAKVRSCVYFTAYFR